MKKFLYPLPLIALLCAYLFSCSNEGFEKPIVLDLPDGSPLDLSTAEIPVKCVVGEGESKACYEISKSACDIIGGREKDSVETCITIDCGWTSKDVEYGQTSTLSFSIKSDNQESCSGEIFYGSVPLKDTTYTISKYTFPDLSFSEDKSIVATATVTCQDQVPIPHNCRALNVKSVPIDFSCGWASEEVKFGGKDTLSFAFDPVSANIVKEEGCSQKISPLGVGEHVISSYTIPGLSYSKDTVITAKATVTCGSKVLSKDCSPLKVKSVPGPIVEGSLSFKKSKSDYENNDTNYFFIGTRVDTSYIDNKIKVTNKDEAECGSVKIKIDGTPAKSGSSVKATAVVYCKYTDTLELASISAKVLPDPELGDCKLIGNWDAMMFKKDTLFLNVPIGNNYGRCKVQNDTLPLKNYSSGKINDITAKVVCGTKTTDKKCKEEVFVADKFAKIEKCHDPRVQVGPGITVVEIACTNDGEPAKNFGCDCSGGDWSSSNIFTINGVKAQSGGCWAYAPIPADIANKESKRVLIEYNKEIGCVAY